MPTLPTLNVLRRAEFPGNYATVMVLIENVDGAPRHTHPGLEMTYILEGEFKLLVDGATGPTFETRRLVRGPCRSAAQCGERRWQTWTCTRALCRRGGQAVDHLALVPRWLNQCVGRGWSFRVSEPIRATRRRARNGVMASKKADDGEADHSVIAACPIVQQAANPRANCLTGASPDADAAKDCR
jgi:hypothetical protein